jgi:hypothetical protein
MAQAAKLPDRWTEPDGTPVVCSMERPTGSLIAERVCRRQRPKAPAAQDEIDKALLSPNIQTRSGS